MAAFLLFPTTVPSDFSIAIPCLISCCLIKGIFTQFAADTAANGTSRPKRPPASKGYLEIILLKISATDTLAVVAARYACPICSLVTPADASK